MKLSGVAVKPPNRKLSFLPVTFHNPSLASTGPLKVSADSNKDFQQLQIYIRMQLLTVQEKLVHRVDCLSDTEVSLDRPGSDMWPHSFLDLGSL